MANEEAKVKGLGFRTVLHCVDEILGEGSSKRVCQELSEDFRHAIEYGEIVAGGWYPINWYRELFQVIRRLSGRGVDISFEVGQRSVNRDFGGIYKHLLKLLTGDTLFKGLEITFKNFYDVGRVKFESTGKGEGRAYWEGCTGFDENMWEEILGSAEQLLKLAGYGFVEIRKISGGRNGCDSMTISGKWRKAP